MAAEHSAAPEAARQRDLGDELARRAGIATQLASAFDAGALSEERLATTLIELEPLGYSLLTRRRWPGSKFATVDIILVGPGGLIIVDTTSSRGATVTDGRLFRDEEDVTDELAQLADLVYTTQRALADIGFPAGEVRAFAAFTNENVVRSDVFGVSLVSEATVVTDIARLGNRIPPAQIAELRVTVEQLFVSTDEEFFPIDPHTRPRVTREQVKERGIPNTNGRATERLTATQIRDALSEGLRRPPVEDWMTFLHADQAHIVRRTFTGPALIRGATGTGKTVVALHRAAHLARTTGGRVLVTTYVQALPQVMESLMSRLAPDVADRVDFRTVHGFAQELLTARRGPAVVDEEAADRLFKDLWDRQGKESALGQIDPTPGYWQDEIRFVLKGRGLTEFREYAELARAGRFRPLNADQRSLVWELYRAYEVALQERQILDRDDLILEAEALLIEEPLTDYAAVIVDEAQDLSCAMIRMLHSLVGDRPDGLTLVSDGQQTIYPGGYTLSEAGVDVHGRGVALRVNYRNTAEIIEFARALVVGDQPPDLEGAAPAAEDPLVPRRGSRPMYTVFASRSVHDKSLVERVRRIVAEHPAASLGDIGVLALYPWHAREAAEALTAAGIPTVELEQYDGRPIEAVKVGTVKRSKGLEFSDVLVVRTPPHLVQAGVVDPDDASAERRLLQRRELYVAMTRARDGLWVGVA